ncbi:MAG: outer membrane protein assembly factor BamE [Chromatiales bacterium]|nr:outer membrane protein assembly factor BamE [Chromatiales bacterium]
MNKFPGIYRIDVQQGNVIDEDMLQRLELGMSKRKVRFILGTPLIRDAFNTDRWDYVYTYEPGGGQRVQRSIAVLFEDDALSDVLGDVSPGMRKKELPKRRDSIVNVEGPGPASGGLLSGIENPFGRDLDAEPVAKKRRGVWSRLTGKGAAPKEVATTKAATSATGASGVSDVVKAEAEAAAEEEKDASQSAASAGSAPSIWQRLTSTGGDQSAAKTNASQGASSASSSLWNKLTTTTESNGSVARPPDQATATPAPAATPTVSSPPAASSLWNRLTEDDATKEAEKPAPPAPAVKPSIWARLTGQAADEDDDKAQTDASSETTGGGIFARIRERFSLPENLGTTELINPAPTDGGDGS